MFEQIEAKTSDIGRTGGGWRARVGAREQASAARQRTTAAGPHGQPEADRRSEQADCRPRPETGPAGTELDDIFQAAFVGRSGGKATAPVQQSKKEEWPETGRTTGTSRTSSGTGSARTGRA